MRLYVDYSKCVGCGECLKACPALGGNKKMEVMSCNNCGLCLDVCPNNALLFKDKIISIDRKKCSNCNACAEACPYNAIIPQNNFPSKCDLCSNYEKPKCIEACAYNAISIVLDDDEKRVVEEVNGWKKKGYDKIIETIELNKNNEIVRTRKEAVYFTNYFPLSYDESIIASRLIEILKEDEISREKAEFELKLYCENNNLIIGKEQEEKIVDFVLRETLGLSFLEFFVNDENLEEIAVTGVNKPLFVYHRKHGWLETDVIPCNEKKLKSIINRIGRKTNRRITMKKPVMNADFKLGRLHAVAPPVSSNTVITLRKFRKKSFTARELVENNTITSEAMAFLSIVVQCGSNILICGNTGSGKTTTLSVLASFIPENDRVIIIEETPELVLDRKHLVRMVSNENISMGELVNNTLRMRPDKLIIGEVRTAEEVSALMNTMLAGQGKGSMATFHAQNSEEAVARLLKLGAMENDLPSIDLIVIQKRWSNPKTGKDTRRVVEISSVLRSKNNTLVIEKIFSTENKNLTFKKIPDKLAEKIALCFDIDKNQINGLILEKQRMVE